MARKKLSVKDKQIGVAFHHANDRARKQNLPFNITLKYLREIAGDECPIFHTPFDWGSSGLGPGKFKPNGAQLDRIEPELGYVVGNVAFISHRANRLKDNGTMQDHYDIADWLWTHLYAKKNAAPPLPKRTNLKSRLYTQHGLISPARPGQNFNHADYHSGAVSGQDVDHSSEESSADGMGCGGKEMGTPKEPTRSQDYGQPEPEIVRLDFGRGHLFD
jgi:hypothetical protein